MPRLRYSSFLRILAVVALFGIWLQIMLFATYPSTDKEEDINLWDELLNINDTSALVLSRVPPELHKYLLTIPLKNYTAQGNTTRQPPTNLTDIQRLIEKHNEAQTIYNEDIFGSVQNDTIIVAIQVHTRLTYLRHLIVSLAQARDIDKALLIFSHDFYDEEINALVQSIDFTKVMQIFYPYSIQTHPHEFPGVDPNDCPRDAKVEAAKKLNCNNALHPDVYGHYREAQYTQTKHHWWWKANRIFNQLECTQWHTGMVLFLEEDHYVAEDFLYMMRLLRTTADKNCPNCEILCLGTYLKTYQYYSRDKRKKNKAITYLEQVRAAREERQEKRKQSESWNYHVYPNLYTTVLKVIITPWHSSVHNMGFAFNRTVWTNIMKLEHQFCAYDDYNWDYSLLHLSQNRPGMPKFMVLLCMGSRVFHIGECGIHHKKRNCNASTVISKVQKLLETAKSHLFPTQVVSTFSNGGVKNNKKLVKGNGGWGDVRDHELCTNMTKIGRKFRKPYSNDQDKLSHKIPRGTGL